MSWRVESVPVRAKACVPPSCCIRCDRDERTACSQNPPALCKQTHRIVYVLQDMAHYDRIKITIAKSRLVKTTYVDGNIESFSSVCCSPFINIQPLYLPSQCA